jgi:hypothetical protein
MSRRARPYSPRAAAIAEAAMEAGAVTMAHPAGTQGVPRLK